MPFYPYCYVIENFTQIQTTSRVYENNKYGVEELHGNMFNGVFLQSKINVYIL